MPSPLKFNRIPAVDRRTFLRFAAVLPAYVSLAATQVDARLEVSRLEAGTYVQARNLGLITAYRTELSLGDNQARNRELWCDLARCGRLLVKGRYAPSDGMSVEAEALLVFGNADDNGNLKGLLRKIGRKFDQAAIIHKGCYRNTHLCALRNLPKQGLSNQENADLGRFRPELVGRYLNLITSGLNACSDRPYGQWDEISFWAHGGGLYPKQSLHRVCFDYTGIHDKG